MLDDKETTDELGGRVSDILKFDLERFRESIDSMQKGATEINKTFLQTRGRITELMVSIEDSIPVINSLNGNFNDVLKTMSDIAKATQRNVVASTEDTGKLFAASQLLGLEVKDIVENFRDIGVQFPQIGKQLEESINYIQSVGANAGQVMRTVMSSMDKMNEFSFQNGVQGLTKMATQASLMNYDMKETFRIADKGIDPEGAIELANTFQRLGVAAGDLVNPFQIMNQSLTNPEGLQNNIINMTKQFAVFDEKTKSFKISEQGILTLRQFSKETNTSYDNLAKTALAAADLDERLRQLNPQINFENEEDKQYLMNIADMKKDGKYEVTLKDGVKKELQNLNQEEFDELIKQQKTGPKSLEDIAKSQLTMTELSTGYLESIKNTIVGGVISTPLFTQNVEGLRNLISGLGESAIKNLPKTDETRNTLVEFTNQAMKLLKDKPNTEQYTRDLDILKGMKDSFLQSGNDRLKQFAIDFNEKIGGISQIEKLVKTNVAQPLTDFLGKPSNYGKTATGVEESRNVNLGGGFTIKIATEPGSTVSQQQLDSIFNSTSFKEFIMSISNSQNPNNKSPINVVYTSR